MTRFHSKAANEHCVLCASGEHTSTPQPGEPGGLSFEEAGSLGALMAIPESTLLGMLGAFALSLGFPQEMAIEEACEFLEDYKEFLRQSGVANV